MFFVSRPVLGRPRSRSARSRGRPVRPAADRAGLDPANALLLTTHLDAAFDQGLMTVEEEGRLRWSSRLDAAVRAILSVDAGWLGGADLGAAGLPALVPGAGVPGGWCSVTVQARLPVLQQSLRVFPA